MRRFLNPYGDRLIEIPDDVSFQSFIESELNLKLSEYSYDLNFPFSSVDLRVTFYELRFTVSTDVMLYIVAGNVSIFHVLSTLGKVRDSYDVE